ncbi:AAA family ATPase [Gracilibacillus oryzae]|uniref:AAA family ATPase n=1 Tax=Gracilibacillus oryzae TaxID=1672701 RepID=A0A7C8L728_9BACI|nr:AAA family ATPase [Gracilibacillus oryzae]KAB8135719.1 AAA family ATPase [Gracilibacillus oryzae]
MHDNTKLPLFIITGASGTGKTTAVPAIRKLMPAFDVIDIDVIYKDVGDWQKLKNIWLTVASEIAKSGRMTILCGTIMPWDVEKCDNYSCFSNIYYINLHCDDKTRENRLKERGWSMELIHEHKEFAKWLTENADKAYYPAMPTINTTENSPEEVALKIKEWILDYTK